MPEPDTYRCIPVNGANIEALARRGMPHVIVHEKSDSGLYDLRRGRLFYVGNLKLLETGVEALRGPHLAKEIIPYDDFLHALSNFSRLNR